MSEMKKPGHDKRRDSTAAARAERRFEAAMNAISDAFYALDKDWRVVAFNPAAEQYFGFPASEVVGRTDISHGEEKGIFLVLLLSAVALTSFLPWRATGRYSLVRGAHSNYRDLEATGRLDNALIFVRSDKSPEFDNAFTLNSPDLTGPIFLRDRGAEANAQIIARYPSRHVYMASAADLRAGRGAIRVR